VLLTVTQHTAASSTTVIPSQLPLFPAEDSLTRILLLTVAVLFLGVFAPPAGQTCAARSFIHSLEAAAGRVIPGREPWSPNLGQSQRQSVIAARGAPEARSVTAEHRCRPYFPRLRFAFD
jgi:hypothetical protein